MEAAKGGRWEMRMSIQQQALVLLQGGGKGKGKQTGNGKQLQRQVALEMRNTPIIQISKFQGNP
jgi:hypothetical protein